MADRSTQTTLQYTAVVSEPCPAQPDKCTTQTVGTPALPQCAPVLHRSVYSGWTPPDATECPEKVASVEKSVSVQKSASVKTEESLEPEQQPSVELVDAFSDSVAGVDCHIIDGVQQCRQHIEEIDKEAACMEELLSQLGCTSSPQRERVIDAIQKLDNLRCHINNTQKLLCSVEIMIHTCEQQTLPVQQTDGSESSRTELVQRELGRLNSRLCCTVLALERSMNKAVCRGAESGLVKLDQRCTSAMRQPCRQSGGAVSTKPVSTCTSRSAENPGACEWAYSQQQQESCTSTVASPAPDSGRDARDLPQTVPVTHKEPSRGHKQPPATDDDGFQQQHQTDEPTSNVEQVSLEDIHRMLGTIISDIDHPAKATTPGELDLASKASSRAEPRAFTTDLEPGASPRDLEAGIPPRDLDVASNASSRQESGSLESGASPVDHAKEPAWASPRDTVKKPVATSARDLETPGDLEDGASPRDLDVASNASVTKESGTSPRDLEPGALHRELRASQWDPGTSRDLDLASKEPEALRKAGEVASTPSVMTDSVIASETSLLLPLEQTSPNNNFDHPPHHQQSGVFDDDVMTPHARGTDEDCGLFHCPSVSDR